MKNRWLSTLKNLLLVTLPTLLLLFVLLELIFRFVIPAAAFPGGRFDTSTQLFKLNTERASGQFTAGKFAQQRATWTINKQGWNNPITYQAAKKEELKRVAIIGDSDVEALQVDSDITFYSLLNERLTGVAEVYSFGKSGAPLSQYLHTSRVVEKKYDPDLFVFLLIHNDFEESIYQADPNQFVWMTLDLSKADTIKEVLPRKDSFSLEHNVWKRMLVKSAVVRYLYYNLRLYEEVTRWRSRKGGNTIAEGTYNANIQVDEAIIRKDSIRRASHYIFQQWQKELLQKGKSVLLVMNAPLQDIHANRSVETSNVWFLHELADSLSSEHGLDFIDLSYPFQQDFKENQTTFHSPYDGHWNEYGHQKVADALYPYLEEKLSSLEQQ